MHVLVTGGTGFLGSHLVEAFLDRGDEVTILDIGSIAKISHRLKDPKLHLVRGSIFDDVLDGLIHRADLIYHMAAVVGVEHYVEDPFMTLNVNVNGTQAVLKAAFKYHKRMVFASTSEVYGRNPKVPWKEDDDRVLGSTRIDRWCYSTSKAVGEHFCFAYHQMGLPVTVVRYFNAYGPRLDAIDVGRVITIFLGQAFRNEPVTVIGDGLQQRCFTYVTDSVAATVKAGLLDTAIGGIFNIGNDTETDIKTLAELIIKEVGSKSQVRLVPQESVYGNSYEDIPRRVPDLTRQREILGYEPKVTLAEGLRETVKYFRSKMPAA